MMFALSKSEAEDAFGGQFLEVQVNERSIGDLISGLRELARVKSARLDEKEKSEGEYRE